MYSFIKFSPFMLNLCHNFFLYFFQNITIHSQFQNMADSSCLHIRDLTVRAITIDNSYIHFYWQVLYNCHVPVYSKPFETTCEIFQKNDIFVPFDKLKGIFKHVLVKNL